VFISTELVIVLRETQWKNNGIRDSSKPCVSDPIQCDGICSVESETFFPFYRVKRLKFQVTLINNLLCYGDVNEIYVLIKKYFIILEFFHQIMHYLLDTQNIKIYIKLLYSRS
jgi:hypothetical protein